MLANSHHSNQLPNILNLIFYTFLVNLLSTFHFKLNHQQNTTERIETHTEQTAIQKQQKKNIWQLMTNEYEFFCCCCSGCRSSKQIISENYTTLLFSIHTNTHN